MSASSELLDVLSSQCNELSLASMAASDLDYAFQLQLQEALTASSSSASSAMSDSHAIPVAAGEPFSDANTRAAALSLQNSELRRCQQEVTDQIAASQLAQQWKREAFQTRHDARVAKTISSMPEDEWEDAGDLYEEPFLSPAPESEVPCELYFTVATAQLDDKTIFGMGSAVFDSDNNLLTELHKVLHHFTGKTAADYAALIAALAALRSVGFCNVRVHTDSVALYNQVTGRWRIRSRKMFNLWSQVTGYINDLKTFQILLHPKNENTHALRLAREVLELELSSQMNKLEVTGDVKAASSVEHCAICLEDKASKDMFSLSCCQHRFCLSCVIQHAEVKVQANQVPVRCLSSECNSTLSLNECMCILSSKWFDLLTKHLTEASIPESERIYCPFPNCSALMLKDSIMQRPSTSSKTHSTCFECTECHRLFCSECRVPWHDSMSCSQYQQLPPHKQNALDAELYRLAQHQKWQRCKKCRRMIELSEGCNHMTCRCGYEFCYVCGAEWIDKKATCSCALWDEGNLIREPLLESDDENDDYHNNIWEEDEDDFTESEDEDAGLDDGWLGNNPFYKSKLCKFWQMGDCRYNGNCKFAHGIHELR